MRGATRTPIQTQAGRVCGTQPITYQDINSAGGGPAATGGSLRPNKRHP
jgi:hypothetical protein